MYILRFGSVVGAAILLSACGGGGGGGTKSAGSTPPPPANSFPSDANDDLVGPLESENFTNVATRGSATFDSNGTQGQTATITATISYDSSNQTYSLTTPTGTISFAPGDIDQSQSNAGAVVYVKESGGRTNSLTLTRPGTSGPITYQYVGGAFWQQSRVGTNSGSGSIDSIVYGVETPDAAVPTSGAANYNVDLIGAETVADGIAPLSGSGSVSVDFASGNIFILGTLDVAPFRGIYADAFSGTAKLSSGTGEFSGAFTFEDFGKFDGVLVGRLFGPGAEEFGAAWEAKGGSGRVATGALLGRRGSDDQANTAFDGPGAARLAYSQTFSVEEAVLSYNFDGSIGLNSETDDFSNVDTSLAPLFVRYDAASNKYYLADAAGMNIVDQSDLSSLSWVDGQQLQYLRSYRWFNDETGFRDVQFNLGFATEQSELIRTGGAGYRIVLTGQAADNAYRNPMNFAGEGEFYVNLETGRIDAYVPVNYLEFNNLAGQFDERAQGEWRMEASLSSDSNAFSGNVTLNGLGEYSGSGSGRFYGPAAQEVGGVFVAEDGAGNGAVGHFVGISDVDVLSPDDALASIRQQASETQLDMVENGAIRSKVSGVVTNISYDPAADSFALTFEAAGIFDPVQRHISFNDSTFVESDQNFRTYTGTLPGGNGYDDQPFDAEVSTLEGAGRTVELNYMMLARIKVGKEINGPAGPYYNNARYALIAGMETSVMPNAGTGTYSGSVIGFGANDIDIYEVEGNVNLLVDFASDDLTANFSNIIGTPYLPTPPSGSTPYDFGDFSMAASVNGNEFSSGSIEVGDYRGNMLGIFFGPGAAEIGGSVYLEKNLAGAYPDGWLELGFGATRD